MALGQNPVPPLNIPIQPLKTVLKWVVHRKPQNGIPLVLTHGHIKPSCPAQAFHARLQERSLARANAPLVLKNSLPRGRCFFFFCFSLRGVGTPSLRVVFVVFPFFPRCWQPSGTYWVCVCACVFLRVPFFCCFVFIGRHTENHIFGGPPSTNVEPVPFGPVQKG